MKLVMIDELDFHKSIIPESIGWESATPHLATLLIWAYKHNHFSDELNNDTQFLQACRAVDSGNLTVASFVEDFLEGAVIKGYFDSMVASFLSDYVSLGVYFGDLEKYFSVSSIYFLRRFE